MKRYIGFAAIVMAVAWTVALRAADASGRWTATFVSQVGEQVYTYGFGDKGTTLTGTAKGRLTGEGKIGDGKIDGSTFTFVENTTYMGMPLAFNYKGTMTSADQIELTRTLMDLEAEKATAKRVK